jgi:hypothetical protein
MPKMQFDCSTTWKSCWQYVTQTPTAKEKMPLLGFENWYRQWKKCRQQGHLRRRHGSCDERLLEKSKKKQDRLHEQIYCNQLMQHNQQYDNQPSRNNPPL